MQIRISIQSSSFLTAKQIAASLLLLSSLSSVLSPSRVYAQDYGTGANQYQGNPSNPVQVQSGGPGQAGAQPYGSHNQQMQQYPQGQQVPQGPPYAGQGNAQRGQSGSYSSGYSAPGVGGNNSMPLQGQGAGQGSFQGSFQGSGSSSSYQGPPFQGTPGSMPAQGGMSQGAKKAAHAVNPQHQAQVYQWFLHYDEIRRRAQMNPIEKQQADGLLARGFSLFMPGQDKAAARQLLSNLVAKYHNATQAIKALPIVPQTKQLQMAYYQYFENAMNLFSDYLRVQDNIFAVDSSGQAIAKQLIQRKLALETLEQNCKQLDAQTRQSHGIAAYQY